MDSTENAWLSTLRPDGSPHLTPVWFVVLDETWWVCASERSVKARNIAADPRVSIALEHGDHPVVAEGSAKIHIRPFPGAVVDAFQAKYGWDITTPFEGGGARVLFEIPVSRWLLKGQAQ
ncbi:pyridoxamine 5'-phosphate oxidase family protein [Amycolatopsis sp. 195334CR]|uniref:pyridoxamine 5'-phosphate oxidase family protein n=1 Tax=Amycolatopsis sp. 195334CR TaxID=2814588 RepID=UPI001A9086B3|nr:pyridoxamine 5'-phosphate oxidase family protein [Amycolatopsis sp. 195334CR]MBN6035030.1 pyridoxamine 5'-phosphate oxidase family protein [Amycolatopsis sp. 195334CR]